MRVLFAATEYIEKGKPTTGFPTYLYRVSMSLLQLGHKPMIIAGGGYDGYRVEDGIEIWTVRTDGCGKVFSGNVTLTSLLISFLINRKVHQVIKERSVDIVQFTSLAGIAAFYHGNTPAVMRLSSYAKTYFSSLLTYDARTLAFRAALERFAAQRCNAVFAPCAITAKDFGKDCGRKVQVIETPFVNDVRQMDYEYVDQYLRDKKYVVFFGSLYAEKGILVIAEILREFLRENKDYYFVFVGEIRNINGEDARRVLRNAAGEFSDRVFIWKALCHDKLYPIIEYSDFVVLPSLMDNFPNACIEAMYFSKIVIGTKGASFEQLIISGCNGFLCRIGDSRDLLEKMCIVTNLDEMERKYIEKNAHDTTKRLQPEYVVKKLVRFYEYVISGSKRHEAERKSNRKRISQCNCTSI